MKLEDLIGKITCADCLDILKQLPDKCIDLVLTDPPYNASNSKISCADKHYSTLNEDWDKGFVAKDFLDLCYDKLKDNGSMIVFCSFEQIPTLIKAAEKHGFVHNIPLIFVKNYSPQVLKANMRVVGATEYAILFYRSYLPKFRNDGKMIFNWFEWERDGKDIPKIHPAQKSVKVLKKLIETFTDPGDVVIDPCFGSGTTARACQELGRNFYGFEINKEFVKRAREEMLLSDESDAVGQNQTQSDRRWRHRHK